MSYCGFITTLKDVRPHSNADRLQLGECFGNVVIVSLEYKEGDIGLYLPSDGQVSQEFGEKNNLLRKKDDAGNNVGGYLDPDKRNIRPLKLRGERSDGLFLPLTCLEYTGVDISTLNIGDRITEVNGHEICCKYIPRGKVRNTTDKVNKTRKKKIDIAPLFAEHADTEQLAYNLGAFKPGDLVEITLKMHGTSQRTGYLPVATGEYYSDSFKCVLKNTLIDIRNAFCKDKKEHIHDGPPEYDWGYVSGTRRVVLENYDGGFYGSNEFREPVSKFFEGKLHKGEEVFMEVVGFTTTGTPIMGDADNKKLQDKEFVKQYGNTTRFSYGCAPDGVNGSPLPQCDFYVYRMTCTNEDGDVVEYPPDYMRYRCDQMGCKYVPLLWRGFIPENGDLVYDMEAGKEYVETPGEWIKRKAEEYYDGPDPIGKTHVREGVVVRIVNRPSFAAFKHKNWFFKCLEGIIKISNETPDMEEAQDPSVNE